MACSVAFAQQPAQSDGSITALRDDSWAEVFDLSRAWRYMLLHDHTYRAALSERAAAQTELAQGRAGLLPQIHFSYSRSRLSGNVTRLNPTGHWDRSDLDFDSTQGTVQLRQPLLNYSQYAQYRLGGALAEQGTTTFYVKRQEAGLRLAHAYFNVLLAHEDLALQESLAASLADMAATLEARYRSSEGTLTDVQETQARLALARANVIDAKHQVVLTTRELQSMLSVRPRRIADLKAEFQLQPPSPSDLDDWLARAEANNVLVRAAQQAVNVADTEVSQAAGQYLPTVDLVATYGKADSENLSALSQRSNTFTIGVQINIPIFTGGYTTANVSRARHDRSRLQHELQAVREQTKAEVTRQYTSVQGGADRVRALETAVESGRLALQSAQRSFTMGATSNVGVLNAQDKLYQAKYELAKARLEYLQAKLNLAAAAGELQSTAFDEINDIYLGPTIALQTVE